MSKENWLSENRDDSVEDVYEESPSRFFTRSLSSPNEINLDSALQRALEYSSDWESSDRETAFSETDVISNMANWIENVGKPALDTQDTLWAQLREKDNEWRRALLDLQFLKEQNKDLQESLSNRPTNQQHESEKTRAKTLEADIEKVEKILVEKEQTLYNITKKVQDMVKNQNQLESNRDNLTTTLNQVTEDFTSKLKSVTRKNQRLETALLQRENDINKLRDAVRMAERIHQERLEQKVEQQIIESRSARSSFSLWTPRALSCEVSTPRRHVDAVEAAVAVFPKDVVLTTPSTVRSSGSVCESRGGFSIGSLCESMSTVAIGGCSLTTFLDTITNLSKQLQRTEQGNNIDVEIEGTLSTFQAEIQKCIENWEHMDVPREDILKLMERIFEEWANEKTMRLQLEGDLEKMKRHHHGIIRRICGDILEIHKSRSSSTYQRFAVLWLPVRVAGWLIYVPIKLGSLSLSTYMYLAKKTFSAAGCILDGVLTKAKGKLMIRM